jgi:uncharacterized protein with PQ loop repeat
VPTRHSRNTRSISRETSLAPSTPAPYRQGVTAGRIDVATVIAVLATSLTVAYGWPQVRRLRRTGDVRGVSLTTATLSVASEIGWLIYLSGEGLWSAVPEAILTMSVSLTLTVALLRAGAEWLIGVAAAAAWAVLLVGGRVLGGPAAIGMLLSVTYAIQLVPSVWTAWRAWCPSGVSPGAWTVRFTQSVLWGSYGYMRSDPPLVTLGVIGSVASAGVLARLVITRARSSTARTVTAALSR